MVEAELFKNKRFEGDDSADIAVLKDDRGDILIRQEADEATVVWLNNKAALEIATWILDNVAEGEN